MAIRTYGKLYLTADKKYWEINDAEPHICIKLKAIFTKIGTTQTQPFKFINNNENCNDLLWFTERYPLKISDYDLLLLRKGRKGFISRINELEAILLPNYKPQQYSLNPPYQARQYQLTGTEIYLKTKRILIGDDIGLGKTLISILSCLIPETKPCIVTVQTHMPNQWKEAIEMFTDLKVHVMKGTHPYNLPAADIYITKYSCIYGWCDLFYKKYFKSAIFDEAQELRRKESYKYKVAKKLSESVDFCLGLTNTPIYNYGAEIFNVLDVIKPDCLGNENDFLREWTGYGKSVKDPKALGTYLRENLLMLRRTRKDVGRELPPVNRIVYTVEHDEDSVRETEEIARKLAIKVTFGNFMESGQAAR